MTPGPPISQSNPSPERDTAIHIFSSFFFPPAFLPFSPLPLLLRYFPLLTSINPPLTFIARPRLPAQDGYPSPEHWHQGHRNLLPQPGTSNTRSVHAHLPLAALAPDDAPPPFCNNPKKHMRFPQQCCIAIAAAAIHILLFCRTLLPELLPRIPSTSTDSRHLDCSMWSNPSSKSSMALARASTPSVSARPRWLSATIVRVSFSFPPILLPLCAPFQGLTCHVPFQTSTLLP